MYGYMIEPAKGKKLCPQLELQLWLGLRQFHSIPYSKVLADAAFFIHYVNVKKFAKCTFPKD